MPVKPIAKASPQRARQIFVHRERVDVTQATMVEIPRAGMMDGMRTAPEVIGRQRQYADHTTYPVIRQTMAKEGAVTAIVLDHEQPHQEARRRHRQNKGEPPKAEIARKPGQRPQAHKWSKCDRNLEDAAGMTGFAVAREDLRPIPRGGRHRRFGWAAVQVRIRGWGCGASTLSGCDDSRRPGTACELH